MVVFVTIETLPSTQEPLLYAVSFIWSSLYLKYAIPKRTWVVMPIGAKFCIHADPVCEETPPGRLMSFLSCLFWEPNCCLGWNFVASPPWVIFPGSAKLDWSTPWTKPGLFCFELFKLCMPDLISDDWSLSIWFCKGFDKLSDLKIQSGPAVCNRISKSRSSIMGNSAL